MKQQSNLNSLIQNRSDIEKHNHANMSSKYYHEVRIREVKQDYFLWVFPFGTSSTYRTERKFKWDQYNQDINNVNQQIKTIQNEINAESRRQQEIIQKELRIKQEEAVQLEIKKQQAIEAERKILQAQINQINSEINNLTIKYNEEVKKTKILEAKLLQINTQNRALISQVEAQNIKIIEKIQSISSKERTYYIAELFDKEDKKEILAKIISYGFDSNELLYYSIQTKNIKLFNFANNYSSDCSNYIVDGKSLLQIAVENQNEYFVEKILTKTKDKSQTLIQAIAQNDVKTIDRLFIHDASLFSQKIAGYTLLQICILLKNPQIEMIKKLLLLAPNLINILTDDQKTIMDVAKSSQNKELIEFISSKIPTNDNLEFQEKIQINYHNLWGQDKEELTTKLIAKINEDNDW